MHGDRTTPRILVASYMTSTSTPVGGENPFASAPPPSLGVELEGEGEGGIILQNALNPVG